MSATPHVAKIGIFGFLRSLFRRLAQRQPTAAPEPVPAEASGGVAVAPVNSAPAHGNGAHQGGRGLELPLCAILSALPTELQARVKRPNGAEPLISIPLDKVLAQLARGAVKVSYGELRRSAPHLFSPATDRDAIPIVLPLAEILARLNTALITRRRPQKQVQIPPEISSPFGSQGRGLSISQAPVAREPAPAAAPSRSNTPVSAAATPFPPRGNLAFAPSPAVPAAVSASPVGANLVLPAMPEPNGGRSMAVRLPRAAPANDTPAVEPLMVPLSLLAEGWPEAVRHELFQFNLLEAKVSLPADTLELALRQGKIAFPWKTVRSWIKPAPLPAVSQHDNAVLELPLKIIAPLFLANKRNGQRRQKVTVDESIPNLFSSQAPPEPVPAGAGLPLPAANPTPTKTSDTNFYPSDAPNGKPRLNAAEVKSEPASGTNFVARYATPNEVVSRAASLDGVAGALIALPDGLMVASRVSPDLNGDTLAAFLPHIFSKVSQCTKELRMGELNNLNFTVGLTPWKIFRVNAIFFAAFGRPGEPLPTAPLAALAAELDRKPK